MPIEPLRWGECHVAPIHRVASFEFLEAYRLRVRPEDGAERTIDLEPVLFGALYGPLRDPVVFGQVRIDPEVRTLVWPSGADFDLAPLHDWPDFAEALASKAREWRESAS